MPDVHDLLHWANRSEVAREVTRRGYRVSVETLNRWHRERKELPAIVERIVFDLFEVETRDAAPLWAERLTAKIDIALWRLGVSAEEEAALYALRARDEAWPLPVDDGVPHAAAERSARVR